MVRAKSWLKMLLAYSLAALASSATAQSPLQPVDHATVRKWVQELDHDNFRVREAAEARLSEAGGAVVEPLTAALPGGSLESIVRGVKILRQVAMSDDRAVAAAARQALEQLEQPAVGTLASHVTMALSELAQFDEQRAYEDFQRLGGRFGSGSAAEGPATPSHAILGKGWQGTAEEVAILKAMPTLDRLSIYGPRITDGAVPHLLKLTHLKRLELYGTKLSAESLGKIRDALRATDIEERRGGLLGVSGTLTSVDCLITSVRPNSAAEQAGVHAGDVIVACQGKAVDSFQSLTEIIATHDGGDTLKLEVLRNGIRVELKATLREWE